MADDQSAESLADAAIASGGSIVFLNSAGYLMAGAGGGLPREMLIEAIVAMRARGLRAELRKRSALETLLERVERKD